MVLVAVRINSVLGNIEWDEDTGDPADEPEFDDANEEIVFIETQDYASMQNGVSDILDALATWSKYHVQDSEANSAR